MTLILSTRMGCGLLIGTLFSVSNYSHAVALDGVPALVPKYREWAEPAFGQIADKNPPILTWPRTEEKKRSYSLRLSQNPAFPEAESLSVQNLGWALFLPEGPLQLGTWYWQVRAGEGSWSETHSFVVGTKSKEWAPPTAKAFVKAIPEYRPRMLVDLPDWETIRIHAEQHKETEYIIDQAEEALLRDIPNENLEILEIKGGDKSETRKLRLDASEKIGQALYAGVRPLCEAYILTQDERFAQAAVQWALVASDWDPKGVTHLANFGDSRIMLSLAMVADTCGPFLSESESDKLFAAAGERANNFFKLYVRTAQELKAVSGHFWQHILHYLFDTAIALKGKDPRAEKWLSFYYETFLARAPLLGGDDGGWAEGISYFRMNMEMLFDIPWRIQKYTGFNFIEFTPWYSENTNLLLYAFPPGSASAGFADNTHDVLEPRGDYLAYADVLSRVMKNPYAEWYKDQILETAKDLTPFYQTYWRYHFIENEDEKSNLSDSPHFRWNRLRYLYELPTTAAKSPDTLPMGHVFEDEGIVALHGQPLGQNAKENLFVAMRSSPFGASGHMLADQNCFNIVYGGERLFYHTGYKVAMSAPHRRQWYMTTKSHNGILINGESQPFEMDAYGWIEHFLDTKEMSYAVGNASHAYSSVEDDFESGLKVFRRHLLLIRPNIFITYDELEARENVEWAYLLHSYEAMQINREKDELRAANSRGSATVKLFASVPMNWYLTDTYPVPAINWRKIRDQNGELQEYPDNAWHFSARTQPAERNRFVGIYQFQPIDGVTVETVEELGPGHYQIGEWELLAELDNNQPARFVVKNSVGRVVFRSAGYTDEVNDRAYMNVGSGDSWEEHISTPRLPPQAQTALLYYQNIKTNP